MHHQSQYGQWHKKGYQSCSEEGVLTSQVTNCTFASKATSTKGILGRHTSPAFPQVRFRPKSQSDAAENGMGILFPLSCLLLLAFLCAQTARLVVIRASKLIKTRSAPFKLRRTSLGARRVPPWRPRVPTPQPCPRPRAPQPLMPRFLHCTCSPAPRPAPARAGDSGPRTVTAQAGPRAPYLGRPPGAPGAAAAAGQRRAHLRALPRPGPARRRRRSRALSPAVSAAASWRRAGERESDEVAPPGAGSRRGRPSAGARRASRLIWARPLATPPTLFGRLPAARPPKSPRPTRTPLPRLGSETLGASPP